nr:neurofilament heavy polypeptide-like [Ipomoea batatas]
METMTSTVPAKSQPLHNFALPHLKWKKNHHSNNHHRGRSPKLPESASSPSRVDSPIRKSQSPLLHSFQSPNHESLAPPPRQSPILGGDLVSESSRRNSASPEKLEKKHRVSETDAIGQKESRSKIVLKLPRKNKGVEIQEETKADEAQEEGKTVVAPVDQESSEEPVPKTWNLRPRKPIQKSLNLNGVQFKAAMIEDKTQSPHRTPIRSEAEFNGAEKKEKRQRFSLALSREEIEEDIFALTGSKPVRRPKKRAKSVQKQLDTLFPGLWLASITPDSYKVSEIPLKLSDISSVEDLSFLHVVDTIMMVYLMLLSIFMIRPVAVIALSVGTILRVNIVGFIFCSLHKQYWFCSNLRILYEPQ